MLKKGDKVIYINKSSNTLKLNNIYIVEFVTHSNILIKNSDIFLWITKDYFITLKEYRKNKLQKLKDI